MNQPPSEIDLRALAHPFAGCCEPLSCYTHLLGALVFAWLSLALVRRGGGAPERRLALGVFGASSVLLLLASGLYHMAAPGTEARAVLMRLDVSAIFVLIAGTYTPAFALLESGEVRRRGLFRIWGIAAAGIVLRLAFFAETPRWLGIAMFLAMGWMGVFAAWDFGRRFGFQFVKLLFLGGAAYSAGAALLLLRWPVIVPGVIGPHEVWHVAVLLGLSLHWGFVWQFAAPVDATSAGEGRARAGELQAERPVGGEVATGAVACDPAAS